MQMIFLDNKTDLANLLVVDLKRENVLFIYLSFQPIEWFYVRFISDYVQKNGSRIINAPRLMRSFN
jgi:hypothetical protein